MILWSICSESDLLDNFKVHLSGYLFAQKNMCAFFVQNVLYAQEYVRDKLFCNGILVLSKTWN